MQVVEKVTQRHEVLVLVAEPGESVSFAEIGRRVGLSRERVRKIVRVAVSDARKSGRRQYYTRPAPSVATHSQLGRPT